jgi:hypothetical protein
MFPFGAQTASLVGDTVLSTDNITLCSTLGDYKYFIFILYKCIYNTLCKEEIGKLTWEIRLRGGNGSQVEFERCCYPTSKDRKCTQGRWNSSAKARRNETTCCMLERPSSLFRKTSNPWLESLEGIQSPRVLNILEKKGTQWSLLS